MKEVVGASESGAGLCMAGIMVRRARQRNRPAGRPPRREGHALARMPGALAAHVPQAVLACPLRRVTQKSLRCGQFVQETLQCSNFGGCQ